MKKITFLAVSLITALSFSQSNFTNGEFTETNTGAQGFGWTVTGAASPSVTAGSYELINGNTGANHIEQSISGFTIDEIYRIEIKATPLQANYKGKVYSVNANTPSNIDWGTLISGTAATNFASAKPTGNAGGPAFGNVNAGNTNQIVSVYEFTAKAETIIFEVGANDNGFFALNSLTLLDSAGVTLSTVKYSDKVANSPVIAIYNTAGVQVGTSKDDIDSLQSGLYIAKHQNGYSTKISK